MSCGPSCWAARSLPCSWRCFWRTVRWLARYSGLPASCIMIAQGRFDVLIEGLERSDEVGVMARAVLVFRDNGAALREAQEQRARARTGRRRKTRCARTACPQLRKQDFERGRSACCLGRPARRIGTFDERSGRQFGRRRKRRRGRRAQHPAAGTVSEAIDELSMAMRNIDSQLANASGVVAEATRRADIAWIMAATLSISLTVEIKPSALATGNGQELASCRQQWFAFGKKVAGRRAKDVIRSTGMCFPAFMFFGLGASCFSATCQSGDAPCSRSLRLRWCRV